MSEPRANACTSGTVYAPPAAVGRLFAAPVVSGSTPKVPVEFDYADESDPGPYPITSNTPIEGGADADGDRTDTGHEKFPLQNQSNAFGTRIAR